MFLVVLQRSIVSTSGNDYKFSLKNEYKEEDFDENYFLANKSLD